MIPHVYTSYNKASNWPKSVGTHMHLVALAAECDTQNEYVSIQTMSSNLRSSSVVALQPRREAWQMRKN